MKKLRTFFVSAVCLTAVSFGYSQSARTSPATTQIVSKKQAVPAKSIVGKDTNTSATTRSEGTSTPAPVSRKAVAPRTEPVSAPRTATKNE